MGRYCIIVVAILGMGCGQTIIQTNDQHARIYMDGHYLGRGRATIKRMGWPRSATLEVRSSSARVKRKIAREFTGSTLIAGALSMYTGFLWGWQFPAEVNVILPSHQSSWGDSDESGPWGKARDGW